MAGPARTATPVPSRYGRTRAKTYGEMMSDRSDGEETRLRGLVTKAFDGKLNNTGTLTLEVGPATTTDIDDPRIGPTTIALLVGLDQNGSASLPSISQAVFQPGKIRLTHVASALTRTLGFALFGVLSLALTVSESMAQSPSLFGVPQSSNPACAAGEYWLSVNSSTAAWKKCQNGSITDLDTSGGGGAPTDADYLVGTANGSLSGEIAVGTAPGGELGGTWASPTIDSGVVSFGELAAGTASDAQIDGSLESDEVTGLADGQISDTLTASTSTTAAANDTDTSIATTAFVQQEIDDGDLLTDNCVLENDGTPIPDACVGDGTDTGGSGEANTHSSPAGELVLTHSTPKVGVDLQLVSLALSDFSVAANVVTVDDDSHSHGPSTISEGSGTDIGADLEEETHATEHQHGGADEIATATATANGIVKAGGAGTLDINWIPTTFATDAEVIAYAQPLATDLTRLVDNCVIENDGTPIPDSCVGDGTDGGGGGGGNSVEVSIALSGGAGYFSTTITGQAWVASGSEIVCSPFGTVDDSLTPEAIAVGALQVSTSDRVAGTGFNLNVYSPNGLEGTVRAHCLGV